MLTDSNFSKSINRFTLGFQDQSFEKEFMIKKHSMDMTYPMFRFIAMIYVIVLFIGHCTMLAYAFFKGDYINALILFVLLIGRIIARIVELLFEYYQTLNFLKGSLYMPSLMLTYHFILEAAKVNNHPAGELGVIAILTLLGKNWCYNWIASSVYCLISFIAYVCVRDFDVNLAFDAGSLFICFLVLSSTWYAKEHDLRKQFYDSKIQEKIKVQAKKVLDCIPHGVISSSGGDINYANPYTCELLSIGSQPINTMRATFESTFNANELYLKLQEAKQQGDTLMTLNRFISKEFRNKGHKPVNFELYNKEGNKKLIRVQWEEIDNELICFSLADWTSVEEEQKLRTSQSLQKIMITSITHELRSPLQGVLGMLEQIQSMVRDPQILHFCRVGLNSGYLMMNIVNDILDYSQIEANKFRLINAQFKVEDIIKDCIELFTIQASRKKILLKHFIKSPIIPAILSDKNRYRQILVNLLSNALKFTFEGCIHVVISYNQEKSLLKTKVIDTGIGISRNDVPKLFQLFGKLDNIESANANPQGVGLGLVMCKKLSIALGGDIKLVSEEKEGTTFTFTIRNQPAASIIEEEDKILNRSNGSSGPAGELSAKALNLTSKEQSFPKVSLFYKERQEPEEKINAYDDYQSKNEEIIRKERVLAVDDNDFNLITLQALLKKFGFQSDSVNINK